MARWNGGPDHGKRGVPGRKRDVGDVHRGAQRVDAGAIRAKFDLKKEKLLLRRWKLHLKKEKLLLVQFNADRKYAEIARNRAAFSSVDGNHGLRESDFPSLQMNVDLKEADRRVICVGVELNHAAFHLAKEKFPSFRMKVPSRGCENRGAGSHAKVSKG